MRLIEESDCYWNNESMIGNCNIIQIENMVKPKYPPRPEHRSMKCVFISDKEILLFGMADNNYLFWISKTDISAIEENTEIIDFILYGEYENLASSGEEISVIKRYSKNRNELYFFNLYQSFDNLGNKIWTSDVDVNIEYDYEKKGGRTLANLIATMPQKLIKLSKDREDSGAYKIVLKSYLDMMDVTLSNPLEDYIRIKDILDIMKQERYLLFSDDYEIREMYCRICDKGDEKYNKYMSYVR